MCSPGTISYRQIFLRHRFAILTKLGKTRHWREKGNFQNFLVFTAHMMNFTSSPVRLPLNCTSLPKRAWPPVHCHFYQAGRHIKVSACSKLEQSSIAGVIHAILYLNLFNRVFTYSLVPRSGTQGMRLSLRPDQCCTKLQI